MRKLILVILICLLAFFGYICVSEGIENSTFNITISSFENVKRKSEKLTEELAEYDEKNEKNFKVKKQNLELAKRSYQSAKSEYEDLAAKLNFTEEEKEEVIEGQEKSYKVDFLWTIIGNYATKEGVKDLDLQFVRSVGKTAPESASYQYADIKFDVTAEYIKIANFLYDLEDDDRLAFEIKDFRMVKNKATFTVYSVPLDKKSLTENQSNVMNESSMNRPDMNKPGMNEPGMNEPSMNPDEMDHNPMDPNSMNPGMNGNGMQDFYNPNNLNPNDNMRKKSEEKTPENIKK